MFGRSSNTNDRPADDQRFVRPITPPGTREALAVPITPAPAPASNESLLAAEDHFEGKLRTARGIRILGTAEGSIESDSHVHIDEKARVTADVSADEVVIAGQYSGNLVCRQRLEILPTGRVSGSIETVKLMLHEGGYVDGELHMQKPSDGGSAAKGDDFRSSFDMPAGTPGPSETPGREPAVRSVGSIRSTVEPTSRQTTALGGGNGSTG
ncbi:MAG: polymer-forming cytoskeletal protein [Chloroflexia bacterium]|nr:polymer-forming cytoskeletal protein [Chloroflexia bacterium]